MSEARRLLEALAKATQPMDFCHVCQSVHSNFKDASNHKEWCAWAKADAYLAQPMTKCEGREGERVAAMEELRDFGVELQAHGVTEDAIVGLKVENLARAALGEKAHGADIQHHAWHTKGQYPLTCEPCAAESP